jgi:hypothetical protein
MEIKKSTTGPRTGGDTEASRRSRDTGQYGRQPHVRGHVGELTPQGVERRKQITGSWACGGIGTECGSMNTWRLGRHVGRNLISDRTDSASNLDQSSASQASKDTCWHGSPPHKGTREGSRSRVQRHVVTQEPTLQGDGDKRCRPWVGDR